jgi:hypothetical protein
MQQPASKHRLLFRDIKQAQTGDKKENVRLMFNTKYFVAKRIWKKTRKSLIAEQ